MAKKISIDPFTRIEGHLAISLELEGSNIVGAKCTGEMFRGFEQILKGRDPLDAQQIVQRICGVCPVSHGLASVAAQEAAYGLKIPANAQIARDIMLAANYIQSHITHFYHLSALDFVDIKGILAYRGNDKVLQSIKKWVKQEFRSDNLFPAAPFLPRYEGKYLQDPEVNISALKNYFTALDMRAKAHQLVAVFAGKMPHMATVVPGGMTEVVTTKKIGQCRSLLGELKSFFETSYITDLLNVAGEFSEFFSLGKGCGNYMAFNAFTDVDNNAPLFPEGVIIDGRKQDLELDLITEEVKYSKYTEDSGFNKTTPLPNKEGAYSWIKAPRYGGKPMEVGPLARIMVGYKNGNSKIRAVTNSFLRKTGLGINDLDSCLGRHAARVLELQIIFEQCDKWIDMLDPREKVCSELHTPSSGKGIGLIEAPRGGLGHWIEISNSKIKSYECIVPTTWNCSPKDDKGIPGPVEQSLIGTTIDDAKNPLEAARIVRSYDPCLACAVH
ncbi:MAG: nickel-dependent hydrogenase large subunit [Desulfotalea sp.]